MLDPATHLVAIAPGSARLYDFEPDKRRVGCYDSSKRRAMSRSGLLAMFAQNLPKRAVREFRPTTRLEVVWGWLRVGAGNVDWTPQRLDDVVTFSFG